MLSCWALSPAQAASAAGGQELKLRASDTLASAGYFHLAWQGQVGSRFELQQSNTPVFDNALRHWRAITAPGFVASGLSDGEYFYRVRQLPDGSWSNTVKVQVRHHTLIEALVLFSLGAFLFVSLLVFILRGNKKQ